MSKNEKVTIEKEKSSTKTEQVKLSFTEQAKEFWNIHLLTWENNFYSKNSISHKQIEECISLVNKLPSETKIMEIGCGTGYFAELLLEKKLFEFLAFDFSTSAIEGTQIRSTNAIFRKVPIESIKKYLAKYPFEYNTVISIELLSWLSPEDLKTVSKLSANKKYVHTFLSNPSLIQKMLHLFKNMITYGGDFKLAKEKYYKDDEILKYFPDGKIISKPELGFNKIITNL